MVIVEVGALEDTAQRHEVRGLWGEGARRDARVVHLLGEDGGDVGQDLPLEGRVDRDGLEWVIDLGEGSEHHGQHDNRRR